MAQDPQATSSLQPALGSQLNAGATPPHVQRLARGAGVAMAVEVARRARRMVENMMEIQDQEGDVLDRRRREEGIDSIGRYELALLDVFGMGVVGLLYYRPTSVAEAMRSGK